MNPKRLYTILALLFLLAACSGNPSLPSLPVAIDDLTLSIDRTDLRAFAIASGGELYAIPMDGILTQLTLEGEEIRTYPHTEQFYVLYAHGEYIYAYDGSQHHFARLNPEDGSITAIGDEIIPFEIKNIVVAGDTLYVLLVLSHGHGHDYTMNEDGYMDFEEQLYSVNLKTGKMKNENIDHIIAIYAGTDGTLYYYAYTDNGYGLYSYGRGRSRKVSEMSEVGYIASFVYETDQLVYLSARDPAIWVRDMTTGRDTIVYEDFIMLTAGDIQYYAGNVFLLRAFFYGETETKLQSFYMDNPTGNTPESPAVTIATLNPGLLNITKIRELSGMDASYKLQPFYLTERMAQLMAGEPDVDVYLCNTTGADTAFRINTGCYVPLNGSAIIREYLDGRFDCISEFAVSPDGDIWMVPLQAHVGVLWYVPENFERFNLTPDDVRYFDDFIETVKRLNAESAAYSVYVDYPLNLMTNLQFQYEMTYNDYPAKKVDFNTELYNRILTTVYGGYVGSERTHAIFRDSFIGSQKIAPNKDKTIFSHMYVNDLFDEVSDPLKDWRALPIPRVSEDVCGNALYMEYAVVNPLSRHKEAAIKLLETIASQPFETIKERQFLNKDPEAYREYYDISKPGFHDILQVIADGMVVVAGYPGEYTNQTVYEYRMGRLTAEEAILALQREVEMWLNE